MTIFYFVRHAQPDFTWCDGMTRPLTAEGEKDSEKVLTPLKIYISTPHFPVRIFEALKQSKKLLKCMD